MNVLDHIYMKIISCTSNQFFSDEEWSKVEGVGVMKDEKLNVEEIEVSNTLGGVDEVGRGEGEERVQMLVTTGN